MELNIVYNMDCLEGMRSIPSNSIDLILTDPPYNISVAGAVREGKMWDSFSSVDAYVEFMGEFFKECERVLKPSGSFYWFHNDIHQVHKLMAYLEQNTKFVFRSFNTWVKPNYRTFIWKRPTEKNTSRNWFNITEYCLYYTFEDKGSGFQQIHSSPNHFNSIKNYLREEFKKTGILRTELGKITGVKSMLSHYLNDNQWVFPTLENYTKLQSTGYFKKPYIELREEYEKLKEEYKEDIEELERQRPKHYLDNEHTNVWVHNTLSYGQIHPTQKPTELIERILKTSSDEGNTVLDPFMGSGTTAISCLNTNRNFIGFELDKDYYARLQKRLESHQLKLL